MKMPQREVSNFPTEMKLSWGEYIKLSKWNEIILDVGPKL